MHSLKAVLLEPEAWVVDVRTASLGNLDTTRIHRMQNAHLMLRRGRCHLGRDSFVRGEHAGKRMHCASAVGNFAEGFAWGERVCYLS
jgi:hypothetical protein